jgi:hypothetical protein
MSRTTRLFICGAVSFPLLFWVAWQATGVYRFYVRYQRTTGRIISASSKPVDVLLPKRGYTSKQFLPDVQYNYSVEGRELVGTHYDADGLSQLRPINYVSGQEVAVYYNPRQPEKAVLVKNAPIMRITLMAIFLFWGVAFGRGFIKALHS